MKIYISDLEVNVVFSQRKSIAIQLKGGEIIVRAPIGVKKEIIVSLIREKEGWIRKNLEELENKRKQMKDMTPFTKEEIYELAEQALDVIPKKVKEYAARIGVTYGRITIRNQKSRWGSCSSKGNLNFNCLLMLFPEDVIDYVVIHELCHRKHMNHSKEFYQEIEHVFPEYLKSRKWLKEQGGIYLSRAYGHRESK